MGGSGRPAQWFETTLFQSIEMIWSCAGRAINAPLRKNELIQAEGIKKCLRKA